MPEPLSPAAQAVSDAANKAYWLWDQMHPANAGAIAAAALHAAADQVVPEEKACDFVPGGPQAFALQRRTTRQQLLAIAAELEGADG